VITLIGIQNFTKRVSYHWAARTGWTSAPMEMPPFGLQPRPVKAKDFTPTAEAVEGFRLVKTFGPTMANWFAPELNMYALKRETYDCGTPGVTCRVEVFNIRVGEPPSTLFEPPAGDSPVSR
jgi:hypothetical protein